MAVRNGRHTGTPFSMTEIIHSIHFHGNEAAEIVDETLEPAASAFNPLSDSLKLFELFLCLVRDIFFCCCAIRKPLIAALHCCSYSGIPRSLVHLRLLPGRAALSRLGSGGLSRF
nr:uncharacterized protein LOC112284882 [Physcomitrium patens]|eukprot:XP_024380989.1 uncharacterized protein LOC112284882 [Physcomitrella patens]